MELGVVAHNLEQVLALLDTPVDYIRLGYPYCRELAEYIWSKDIIEKALKAIISAGKIPQFQWLISPFSTAGDYINSCIELMHEFPQTEVILSHWGGLKFDLADNKLAADGLAIYNSDLVHLLREQGVSIVGLTLKLDTDELLSAVIDASPADTVFEYQLWGAVMSSHWWSCSADKGICDPKACTKFTKFDYRHLKFNLFGSSLWHFPGVDNLSQAKKFEKLGIRRGLIQLANIQPQSVPELIGYCLAQINE